MKKLLLLLLIATSLVSCNKYTRKKADWKIVVTPMSGSGTVNPNTGNYYENLEVVADDYTVSYVGYDSPTFEHSYRGEYYNTFKIFVSSEAGSKISLYRDGVLIQEQSLTYSNVVKWTNQP
jgi:hypothetical protein